MVVRPPGDGFRTSLGEYCFFSVFPQSIAAFNALFSKKNGAAPKQLINPSRVASTEVPIINLS